MPQNVIYVNFKRYSLGLDKMYSGPRVYSTTTTIFVDFENRLKIGHI